MYNQFCLSTPDRLCKTQLPRVILQWILSLSFNWKLSLNIQSISPMPLVTHSFIRSFKVYNWFSLFAVLMFYRISMNTELANSEPLLPGDLWGQVPTRLWSWLSSTSQHLNLFYTCFCSKTSYFLSIIDLFTLNRWPRALWPMTGGNLSKTYFLHEAPSSLLVLRSTWQYISVRGPFSKVKSPTGSTKKSKKRGARWTGKKRLAYVLRAETRQSVTLSSAGNVRVKGLKNFLCRLRVLEWLWNHRACWLRGYKKL